MTMKRPFLARYDGRCPECHDRIYAGEDMLVYNDDDEVIHAGCYDGELRDD